MASLTCIRSRKLTLFDLQLCVLLANGPIFPYLFPNVKKVVFDGLQYYFSDGLKSYCDTVGSLLLLNS